MSRPNVQSTSDDFEFAALGEAKNYRAALLDDFAGFLHGRVLEVGAGVGQFTAELRRRPEIERLVSIEPDPGFCNKLRESFGGHEIVQGVVSDLQTDDTWNAILSVNVLEHIEADQEELKVYHQLLKPAQGALCLFVPARPEIYAPIDKDFGHFRRYTSGELRTKLENAGFTLTQFRYFNFAGYFLWWLRFCLFKKRTFDVSYLRLFDRMIFPAVHALEANVCRPPIGQSLFAVARAR